jgi:hypothetical protein
MMEDINREEMLILPSEAEDIVNIVKAYGNGEIIQQCDDEGIYHDVAKLDMAELVTKPCTFKVFKPKYKAFSSVENCWKEMQNHTPFGWIKSKPYKNHDKYAYIQVLDFSDKKWAIKCSNDFKISFKTAFEEYTFMDGKPFGESN